VQRARVEIRCERDPRTPKLVAVRDHLHQVLMNLLLNAIQASPPGGLVRLNMGPDPDGDGVVFEVTDSGPGIPEEHLSQIFDPFFTTKGPDKGSGLGLMICHRLVSDHGGTIEVRSREGAGATFCVRLPAGGEPRLLDPSSPA
jgi:signal transduction histidine kinase